MSIESKPKRKRTSQERMVEARKEVLVLNEKGLTIEQVSKVTEICPRSVRGILAAVENSKQEIKLFKEARGDALSFVQKQILDLLSATIATLTPEELASMTPKERMGSLQQLATSFGITFDKARLETGLSTSNSMSLLLQAQKGAELDFRREAAGGKLPGE